MTLFIFFKFKSVPLNSSQLHFFHLSEGHLNTRSVESLLSAVVCSVHFMVHFENQIALCLVLWHLFEPKVFKVYGKYLADDRFLKK